MAIKYQFDVSAAMGARGAARIAHMDQVSSDFRHGRRTSDFPLPQAGVRSLAQLISKSSKVRDLESKTVVLGKRKLHLSDYNKGYCKPCRRIFDGVGNLARELSAPSNTTNFIHWDAYYVKKSATQGCPLCLLLYRAIRDKYSALTDGELIPARYHFGELGIGNTDTKCYVVIFSYHAMEWEDEKTVPVCISTVTITLEKASATRLLTKGASVSSGTHSQGSFAQILEWLSVCNKSHSCYRPRQADVKLLLPSRLIDVGTASEPGMLRIVDSGNLPWNTKYLTLSHCWGDAGLSGSATLTSRTLPSFREHLPLDQLPVTFADAVTTAHALSIRYMWIDALCIIQDDERDWKEQAATMWQVYSNAYINLSATASSDSAQGLFRERPTATTLASCAIVDVGHDKIPPNDYCCYNFSEWVDYVANAPVNGRAWVLQERLLAPRIVHFTQDQIFWECHEQRTSETFPCGLPTSYITDIERPVFRSLCPQTKPETILRVWHTIVKKYTCGKLTYTTDKLIAVSALARQLSQSCPIVQTYLAGIWGGLLLDQLLWSTESSAERTPVYRAPSWSWASMDGPVYPNFNSEVGPNCETQIWRKMVEVHEATVIPNSDPFGSVSSGILRLCGPLLKAKLEFEDKIPSRRFEMQLFEYSEACGWLDDANDHTPEDPQDFFFMPLLCFNDYYRGSDEEEPEITSIKGLLLTPTETGSGEFRRVGICSVNEYDAGKLFCALANQEVEDLQFEAVSPEKLTLDDFLPPKWSGKPLDCIPKEFTCYVISIV